MYRNPDSELNIRRIDSRATHGFQFHITRGDIQITRLFSDLVLGGKEAARELARSYRDRMYKKLPDRLNLGPRRGVGHSNSGVMGISITEDRNADGTFRIYAQATARPPGRKPINRKVRLEDDTDLSSAIEELTKWRKRVYAGKQP